MAGTSSPTTRKIPTSMEVPLSYEYEKAGDVHRIIAFGKLAELCDQFIRKGRKIYAEGRLHSHTWTDNEGHQRAVTEIILSEMTLLDKKPEEVAEVPAEPSQTGEPISTLNGEQRETTNL